MYTLCFQFSLFPEGMLRIINCERKAHANEIKDEKRKWQISVEKVGELCQSWKLWAFVKRKNMRKSISLSSHTTLSFLVCDCDTHLIGRDFIDRRFQPTFRVNGIATWRTQIDKKGNCTQRRNCFNHETITRFVGNFPESFRSNFTSERTGKFLTGMKISRKAFSIAKGFVKLRKANKINNDFPNDISCFQNPTFELTRDLSAILLVPSRSR